MARKVYTRKFRETAVRLASQPDVSVEKVANELGITGWTLRAGGTGQHLAATWKPRHASYH